MHRGKTWNGQARKEEGGRVSRERENERKMKQSL